MKKHTSILFLLMLIISCQSQKNEYPAYDMAVTEQQAATENRLSGEAASSAAETAQIPETDKKKIIRDGRMGLKVKELEKSKSRIDTLVRKRGGYYANESYQNTDYESSWNLKVRIPAANFDKFITEVESGDGEVLFKEVDARDVTDQFIDLETRLENKRNYLTRYRELVKQARSVKDILEIEERIRGLEEEIESTTGRLKYLSDQVAYSTLDLTLTRKKDFKFHPDRKINFWERLKQSLSRGWFGFIDFLLFILRLWPFWLIVILLLYFLKKSRKKVKTK